MFKRRICSILIATVLVFATGCSAKKEEAVVEPKAEETVEASISENVEVVEETPVVETVSADSTVSENIQLSDDIYSFQISVDGQVFQLPMDYDTFAAAGWVYNNDLTEELAPNQATYSDFFEKGNLKIMASFVNFGLNVEPLSNCYIGSITVESGSLDAPTDGDITLPKGIKMGVSTLEEVKAAFGEPTTSTEGDTFAILKYEYDFDQSVRIDVDTQKNIITKIEVENYIQTEEQKAKNDSAAVNDEVPEVVTKYVAPTQLGTNFDDFILEFDGSLYKLPAPISEFEKNGWEVMAEDLEKVVVAQGYERITIMKNNQKENVTVMNYTDQATSVHNCFVEEIEADVLDTNVSAKAPYNIAMGMSGDEVKKIISTLKNVEVEDEKSFIYYTIPSSKSKNDETVIRVQKDKNVVSAISMSCTYSAKETYLGK